MPKIFGIGLPRTGTASLSEALTILGYKTRHYPKYLKLADDYDALVDTPIWNSYPKLDIEYPESKFILTTREITEWLESCRKASRKFRWANIKPNNRCGPEVYQSHVDLFGTTVYVRNKFIDGYANHIKKVLDYFNRNDNLLIFNVVDGWDPLCNFLDKTTPRKFFPHRNKS